MEGCDTAADGTVWLQRHGHFVLVDPSADLRATHASASVVSGDGVALSPRLESELDAFVRSGAKSRAIEAEGAECIAGATAPRAWCTLRRLSVAHDSHEGDAPLSGQKARRTAARECVAVEVELGVAEDCKRSQMCGYYWSETGSATMAPREEHEYVTGLALIMRFAFGFDRVAVCKFVSETTCEVVAENRSETCPATLKPLASSSMAIADFMLSGCLPRDGILRPHHVSDVLAEQLPVISLATPHSNPSRRGPGPYRLGIAEACDPTHASRAAPAPPLAQVARTMPLGTLAPSASHRAVMAAMGARSEVVVPVTVHGVPWGLVVYHCATERHVTPPVRALIARRVRLFEADLGVDAAHETREFEGPILSRPTGHHVPCAVPSLNFSDRFADGLLRHFAADGAAVVQLGGPVLAYAGITPAEDQVLDLAAWLPSACDVGVPLNCTLAGHPLSFTRAAGVVHLACLAQQLGESLGPSAAGLLAVRFPGGWILLFRRSSEKLVTWAGSLAGTQACEPHEETLSDWCTPWSGETIARAVELQRRVSEEMAAAANIAASQALDLQRQLKQKAEFIATIRTPMNAVLGFLSLLSEIGGMDDTQMTYVDSIKGCSEHLLALINDILDFNRLESVALDEAPFGVRQAAEDCALMFAPICAKKGIELKCEIDDAVTDALAIVSDRMKFKQLIINLLGNATKFTREGHVALRVGCETVAPSALSSERSSPPSTPSTRGAAPDADPSEGQLAVVSLEVEDTGCGIAEENLRKIFEPFVQADAGVSSEYGGTGLGLAISRRIADAMGGELVAESTIGVGTRFVFVCAFRMGHLPSLSRNSSAAAEGSSLSPRKRSSTQTSVGSFRLSPIMAASVAPQRPEGGVELALPVPHPSTSALPALISARRRRSATVTGAADFLLGAAYGEDGAAAAPSNDQPRTPDTEPSGSPQPQRVERVRSPLSARTFLEDRPLPRSVSLTSENSLLLAHSRSLDGGAVGLGAAATPFAATALSVGNLAGWRRRFSGLRVLVVEDNAMNYKILSTILAKLTIAHEWAKNGKVALAQLSASLAPSHLPFSVIMMDMVMPEMDGLEATRHIRNGAAGAQYVNVPIIALTANASSEDAEACRVGGMDAFLAKPFSIDGLVAALDVYVEPLSPQTVPGDALLTPASECALGLGERAG